MGRTMVQWPRLESGTGGRNQSTGLKGGRKAGGEYRWKDVLTLEVRTDIFQPVPL